jgi:hypothetical protein
LVSLVAVDDDVVDASVFGKQSAPTTFPFHQGVFCFCFNERGQQQATKCPPVWTMTLSVQLFFADRKAIKRLRKLANVKRTIRETNKPPKKKTDGRGGSGWLFCRVVAVVGLIIWNGLMMRSHSTFEQNIPAMRPAHHIDVVEYVSHRL